MAPARKCDQIRFSFDFVGKLRCFLHSVAGILLNNYDCFAIIVIVYIMNTVVNIFRFVYILLE